MRDFLEKLRDYFTKRNTFKVVVIELMIIGLLLCVLLMMSVEVDVQLRGAENLTVELGSTFKDPGANAYADGHVLSINVKGQVDTSVPGTYTLCYKARYLLSTGKAYRTVQVVEVEGPSIALIGGESITVTMGASFEDPGYTAKDSAGVDLTDRVEVEGAVDMKNKGTYTLTYTVTDDSGHSTSVQRTVEVVAAAQTEIVEPNGKVIYLTFDDGPGKYTQQLLEVLEEYDVKATFFVVNTSYSKKTETLQAIAQAGHAIGIHSLSHDYNAIYASEEAFFEDLYGMQAIIEEATGQTTMLLRFPGGTSNSYCTSELMTTLTEKVTELGFRYFDWNVDSGDAGGATTAEEVYNNVIKGIGSKTTAVVLQHDIKSYSVEAVEMIIKWGLENGYSFEALTTSSPACQHR